MSPPHSLRNPGTVAMAGGRTRAPGTGSREEQRSCRPPTEDTSSGSGRAVPGTTCVTSLLAHAGAGHAWWSREIAGAPCSGAFAPRSRGLVYTSQVCLLEPDGEGCRCPGHVHGPSCCLVSGSHAQRLWMVGTLLGPAVLRKRSSTCWLPSQMPAVAGAVLRLNPALSRG